MVEKETEPRPEELEEMEWMFALYEYIAEKTDMEKEEKARIGVMMQKIATARDSDRILKFYRKPDGTFFFTSKGKKHMGFSPHTK
mgnify:CR=1 FL=1